MNIQFIGCGNMGEIILNSLFSSGINSLDIFIQTKTFEKQEHLKKRYNINIGLNKDSEILILALKPDQIDEVDLSIFGENILIISILAGISITKIKSKGLTNKIIRAMPNTPISVGSGIIGYFATSSVGNEEKKFFDTTFSKVGIIVELNNEDLIDKITALSGSGPAYFYYFTEQIKNCAIKMGFSSEISTVLANNIFIGAADLLKKSNISVEKLRRKITSPGGTTEKAINTFETNLFIDNIFEAINNAYERAKELNK